MPPRPSKSPVRARPVSPAASKSPKPVKSTTKKTPTPKKARSGRDTLTYEAPANETPGGVAEGSTDVAGSTLESPGASSSPPSGTSLTMVLPGVFGALVGLVALLYVFMQPMSANSAPGIGFVSPKAFNGDKPMSANSAPGIGFVSPKAFNGDKLLLKDANSAIIIFMDKPKLCQHCDDLSKELDDPRFVKAAERWKEERLLKIGKVKCWKHDELCRTFGVSGDDPTTSTGYPHVLHFKAGVNVGSIDARTSSDFQSWVREKQLANEL
ncbi:hypothetical protein AB1Y20_012896 [Prymnesium parvum]|uniref:Uncharacterized protein n=1 Tax=Prymnesium parvum TaxID=97485 RepID=A0AB34IKL9_PRYPA